MKEHNKAVGVEGWRNPGLSTRDPCPVPGAREQVKRGGTSPAQPDGAPPAYHGVQATVVKLYHRI